MLVREDRRNFVKAAKGLGYDVYTMWHQTFGERPFEGPKGHLDGILSAKPGSDPEPLFDRPVGEFEGIMHPALSQVLHEAFNGETTVYDPVISARPIDPTTRIGMKDFVEAGKYASRQTFPTLRVIAGQLDRGGTMYRLTNVDGRKCRKWDEIETMANPAQRFSWSRKLDP